MAALQKLLGCSELESKEGKHVYFPSLEGKVIFLYFSASWCPPCKQFTPVFVQFYQNMKTKNRGDEFEVVWISWDKDEDSYKEYFKKMPWIAMPFKYRKQKDKMSRKMKVSGIPTVVILDREGKVVTTKGKQLITKDQEGKNFPWVPKTVLEILGDARFLSHNEEKRVVHMDDIRKLDGFALYFGAHWSAPSRAFTPRLMCIYQKLKAAGVNSEIIFCSNDQDEEGFNEMWADMPWLCLPPGDDRLKALIENIPVEALPTLVTVKQDGTIINKDARSLADEDPSGEKYPWAPKELPDVCPLEPSAAVFDALNNEMCCILSTNSTPNKQTCMLEFMTAAKKFNEDHNMKEKDRENKIRFLTADELEQLRVYDAVINAVAAKKGNIGIATVIYINLPNDKSYQFLIGEVTKENVYERALEFKNKQLSDEGATFGEKGIDEGPGGCASGGG